MSDFPKFGGASPATLEEPKPGSGSTALYNIMTFLFLGLTVLAVLFVAAIFLNPGASYNPFPPQPTPPTPTLFIIPSATPTIEIEQLPPTWTPAVTPTLLEPVATEVVPGGTPVAETPAEATPLGGEAEGTPATTATTLPGTPTFSPYPFTPQEGTPEYTQNPEDSGGCDYLGIAGYVYDLNGEPVDGIAVVVTGENFETLFITQFTLAYGAGSYYVELNKAPIEAEFEVRLWSVSGQALSDVVVVRTRATCEENLIFVNFVQNHEFEF